MSHLSRIALPGFCMISAVVRTVSGYLVDEDTRSIKCMRIFSKVDSCA